MNKKLSDSVGKYFLGLIIAHFLWAAAGPVIKITLNAVPPFTFLFIRFLIVSILVLPYTITLLLKEKVNPKDYLNILLLGLSSQTSIIFIFLALDRTTVLDAVLIGLLGPIISMAAGHYFYHEKLNKNIIIGLIITILGTLIVVFEPIFSYDPLKIDITNRIIGNLLVITSSISSVFYVIWSKISLGQTNKIIKKSLHFVHLKKMTKEYSTNLLMSLAFFVGMISMAPFALVENLGLFGPVSFNISQIPEYAVIGIFYMAIFSSIVAYYLFEFALKKVTVTDSAVMSYIGPLFSVPFVYILLGEVPTRMNIIGAAIIGIGILIAEVKIEKEKKSILDIFLDKTKSIKKFVFD